MVKVDGFKRVTSDVTKEESQVEYDPSKTSPEKLAEAINAGTNFKASVKM